MDKPVLDGWIPTSEAAEMTGYSAAYLRGLAGQGRVQAQKVGCDWFFEREPSENCNLIGLADVDSGSAHDEDRLDKQYNLITNRFELFDYKGPNSQKRIQCIGAGRGPVPGNRTWDNVEDFNIVWMLHNLIEQCLNFEG